MMNFEWIPGQAMSQAALERLQAHFPRPDKPPFEAWFMSEINYYHDFLIQDPDDKTLESYLFDTGGGIRNFGRFQEWVDWYHYFLHRILARFDPTRPLYGGSEYIPLLMGYFINLYSRGQTTLPIRDLDEATQRPLANADYPGGVVEPYPGFREDIFHTLGRAVMASAFWQDQDLRPEFVHDELYDGGDGQWVDFLNISLFFCLMYLTPPEIETWVASFTRISGAVWLREIRASISNLRRFLHMYPHPERVPQHIRETKDWQEEAKHRLTIHDYLQAAGLGWWNGFLVFNGLYASRNLNDYIPPANLEAFWQAVEQHPTINPSTLSRTLVIDGYAVTSWIESVVALIHALHPENPPVEGLEASDTLHDLLKRAGEVTIVWQDDRTLHPASIPAHRFIDWIRSKYPNVTLKIESQATGQ